MKREASARGCAVGRRERDGVDEGGAVRGRGTRRRTQRPLVWPHQTSAFGHFHALHTR